MFLNAVKPGADKIIFGSDCPWEDTGQTYAYINALGLTEEAKEKIFYKNALRLLS